MLLDAVYDDDNRERCNSAGDEPRERLQHHLLDGPEFVQAAAPRDDRDGQRLKKAAAQAAANGAKDGLAEKSEFLFMRHGRGDVAADHAAENLNRQIQIGPDHVRALSLFDRDKITMILD
jgi:hypothetical protein